MLATTSTTPSTSSDTGPLQPAASEALSALLGPKGKHPRMWANNSMSGLFRAAASDSVGSTKETHRMSCHRCGNIRKNTQRCTECPYVFCGRCVLKMQEEHGKSIFDGGCPVCKDLCCCGSRKSTQCTRTYHCYKKCPSTRTATIAMLASVMVPQARESDDAPTAVAVTDSGAGAGVNGRATVKSRSKPHTGPAITAAAVGRSRKRTHSARADGPALPPVQSLLVRFPQLTPAGSITSVITPAGPVELAHSICSAKSRHTGPTSSRFAFSGGDCAVSIGGSALHSTASTATQDTLRSGLLPPNGTGTGTEPWSSTAEAELAQEHNEIFSCTGSLATRHSHGHGKSLLLAHSSNSRAEACSCSTPVLHRTQTQHQRQSDGDDRGSAELDMLFYNNSPIVTSRRALGGGAFGGQQYHSFQFSPLSPELAAIGPVPLNYTDTGTGSAAASMTAMTPTLGGSFDSAENRDLLLMTPALLLPTRREPEPEPELDVGGLGNSCSDNTCSGVSQVRRPSILRTPSPGIARNGAVAALPVQAAAVTVTEPTDRASTAEPNNEGGSPMAPRKLEADLA